MGLRPAKFHEKLREAQGIPRCARWFFDPVNFLPCPSPLTDDKNRSSVPLRHQTCRESVGYYVNECDGPPRGGTDDNQTLPCAGLRRSARRAGGFAPSAQRAGLASRDCGFT